MKDFMSKRPMLAFLIVSVAASVISTWMISGNPMAFFATASAGAVAFKLAVLVTVMLLGVAVTYAATRLALDPTVFGFVPAGAGYTPGRRLTISMTPETQLRTADEALNELDRMIGLGSVKAEINKLLASLEIEKKRRDEGLPVAVTSRHMVFTGPPGVGKTVVARSIGDIYRSLGVLRKGHVVETAQSDLVAGYIGQTAIKTMEVCKSALDGILIIDEAYALTERSEGSSFGKEAVDTLLKFMEDNRERLIVIVAGYPDQMRRFIAANPGLESRFTRTIDFPSYEPAELAQILRLMATQSGYVIPADIDKVFLPWVATMKKRENWGNAREIRTLLEHAREAHAMRVSATPGADLSRLEVSDLVAAMANRNYALVTPRQSHDHEPDDDTFIHCCTPSGTLARRPMVPSCLVLRAASCFSACAGARFESV